MKRKEEILVETERYVQGRLQNEASGHDWWHIVRVRNLARRLAAIEQADTFLVEMAALLHDIADEKIAGSEEAGLAEVVDWLTRQGVAQTAREEILFIIGHMSYKAGANAGVQLSLEGQIAQDADRLDALGAIGIARTMAYSGNKGRLIHDPNLQPRQHLTVEEYRSGKDTAIMHFYEKLLKLRDLMNTDAARQMAAHRHQVMEEYLAEFYVEWDGKA